MTNEQANLAECEVAEEKEAALFDVAVIGAGPAGLTAGLYAARGGLSTAIFERISPGGQLAQTEIVENYPGFPEGADGFELAYSMKQQADRFGVQHIAEEVIEVQLQGGIKTLTTSFGSYKARSVIIATGARPRKLGINNEDELQGRGVSYCATCDGNFFRDKEVMVVGGGNTAVGDVVYLSRICKKVYLVHRRDQLRCTAVYRKRLEELSNLEIVWSAIPQELLQENGALSGVKLKLLKTDEERSVAVNGLFVAVGTQPNTSFLGDSLTLNEGGYIVCDESGETGIPGVYAAGDVRTKFLRQVVTAVSDGAACAEAAAEYLAV